MGQGLGVEDPGASWGELGRKELQGQRKRVRWDSQWSGVQSAGRDAATG